MNAGMRCCRCSNHSSCMSQRHDACLTVPCRYEPKDPNIKVGMREMLVQPGHLKGGYLLVTPITSQDK